MKLNEFSVRVVGGQELAGGYVELDHNQTYKLRLRNFSPHKVDSSISIDGKHIGSWRINENESIEIERPADEARLFTFFEQDSDEAQDADVNKIIRNNRGLIQVTFKPGYYDQPRVDNILRPWHYYTTNDYSPLMPGSSGGAYYAAPSSYSDSSNESGLENLSCSLNHSTPGITGLTGASNQYFGSVGKLDKYISSLETTINLRLICKKKLCYPLRESA